VYYRTLILFVAIFTIACANEPKGNSEGTPVIDFYQNEFDFGTIQMGEKVAHDFMFKNIGDGDLYIENVVSDCGCTVVDFKRRAISPGEESSIEAVFDSNGLPGFQLKKITIYSNAGDSVLLTVAAVVDYELDKGFN